MATIVEARFLRKQAGTRRVRYKQGLLSYRQQWHVLTGVLLTFDAVLIWASLTLAYLLRISSGIMPYDGPRNDAAYIVFALLGMPVLLVLFAVHGLYRQDNLLGGSIEYQQIVKACATGIVAMVLLSFLWRDFVLLSRGWLILSWILSTALICSMRFLVRRVAYALRRCGWLTAGVLIVGANDQGIAMAQQWQHSSTSGMHVIGFLDDFKPSGTTVFEDLKVIGRPSGLASVARKMGAAEVVVVPNSVAWESFEEIVTQASTSNGYKVRLSPGFYELLATGVAVANKTFVPLFTINETRIVGLDAVLKSLLDYGLAISLSVLALPALIVTSISLRLLRKGDPVFARLRTYGQSGKAFTMYKLNLPVDVQALQARPGHALSFEQLLSRRGLDKLPQLLNVLLGQMSLVGPRPRLMEDRDTNLLEVSKLQTVKPGVIGPWMVSGFWTSSDETRDELYYVRNWTIWMDIQILFQTTLAFLRYGRRAAQLSPTSTQLSPVTNTTAYSPDQDDADELLPDLT